jgi:hypothetical protein
MRASVASIRAAFAGGCGSAFRKAQAELQSSRGLHIVSCSLARVCALIGVVAVAAGFTPAPAHAAGILRLQKVDGSVRVYDPVALKYTKATGLVVTTRSGRDALIIKDAACSYVGDAIMRCLLDQASYEKNGTMNVLEFDSGTLYYNRSTSLQHLPRSTQGIPPKGVVVSIRSKRGTYISLTGTIDKELQ